MISDMLTFYRSGKNNVVLNSGGGEPGSLLARPDQTQTRAGQLGYKEVIFFPASCHSMEKLARESQGG